MLKIKTNFKDITKIKDKSSIITMLKVNGRYNHDKTRERLDFSNLNDCSNLIIILFKTQENKLHNFVRDLYRKSKSN